MEQRSGPYVLKRNYAVRPNERGKRPQGAPGLGQILQDCSAYHRVKVLGARDASDVAFHKTHVGKPGIGDARSRRGDGGWVALDPDHRARWADKPRSEHRDVADPGADVEHPLARADSRVAEQALGERIPDHRLADQPGVLCACRAQWVGRIGGRGRHAVVPLWAKLAARAAVAK